MAILAALPSLVWIVLFLALVNPERPLREAALAAFTVVWLVTLGFTWLLSPARALSLPWLATLWATLLVALVFVTRRRIATGLATTRSVISASDWRREGWLIATVVMVFAVGTLVSATLYPIVNYDSLTCHGARVYFWAKNHTVAPYPTTFGPQLFEGPLGAYGVLNLKVLAGGVDRLANLVQWSSYLFALVAVSLVSMRLGATRAGQQVATLTAVSIPMAILQASTTQNDLNVGVFCLTFAYCTVEYVRSSSGSVGRSRTWVLWAGCVLGLALLAKPTAYMYTAPFVAWLIFHTARQADRKRLVWSGLAVVVVAILLNLPSYANNVRLLGGVDVIGMTAPGVPRAVSRAHDPVGLLTTAVKNGSMELGTPFTSVNLVFAQAARGVAGSYGGIVEDPRGEEDPTQTYRLDNRVSNHDVAPAPLPVLLIILAGLIVLVSSASDRVIKMYVACALAGGFLVAALISWNPFINRLLLGALLLLTPVVGIGVTVLQRSPERWRRILPASLVALCLGWGMIVMLFNSTNRLIPPTYAPFSAGNRNLGYWNASYDELTLRILTSSFEGDFKAIAAAVRSAEVSSVGLNVRTPMGQFPILPLLSMLPECSFSYVGDTLFPDQIQSVSVNPPVVLELLSAEDYPLSAKDRSARGQMLIPPRETGGHVFLLYYAVPRASR